MAAHCLIKNSIFVSSNVARRSFQYCRVFKRGNVISAFSTPYDKSFAYQSKPCCTNQRTLIKSASSLLPCKTSSYLFSNHEFQIWTLSTRLSSSSPLPPKQDTSSPSKQDSPPSLKQVEEEDDLRAILKDKSLSVTEKFKIIFKQYGLVMVAIHLFTSAIWVFIFYQAISRGVDITPFLERTGVFDYMERWGISFVDKVKSSGASDYVVTYVLYELAKPVRYIVTLFGTMYAVRFLRRKGFIKRPPKSATMSDLVQTQGKLVRQRVRKQTQIMKDKYNTRVVKTKGNGKRKNGFNEDATRRKDANSKPPAPRRHSNSQDEVASKKKTVPPTTKETTTNSNTYKS